MTWSVLPRKRKKPVDSRPTADSSIMHDNKVSVHIELCRLLTHWRDDPDRLAVACAAYSLAGYWIGWLPDEVAGSYPEPGSATTIDVEEARRLVDKALRRRNKKLLRARAEGLLMALEEEAQIVESHRLHSLRVSAGVIECRRLSREERWARLRREEESRAS